MNIALFGYGKMGKEIESFAVERGHKVSARIDSGNPKENFDYSAIDVIIEFSKPEFAADNIRFAVNKSIPIVVGTTGWYDHLDSISAYCKKNLGSVLYATNFSVGVNAFFDLNRYLAKIMNNLNEYEASVLEIHHTEKLDAPSGTGISIAEQIIDNHGAYLKWENVKKSQISEAKTLSIASERLPNVPGTHEVTYSSEIDTIEIKHTAHNRKGFAQGSIIAAEWIQGKRGIFTMQDVLKF